MTKSKYLSILAGCAFALCLSLTTPVATAETLQLNGAASFKDLGEERFVAALYMDLPSSDYSHITSTTTARRMEMRMTSSYSKRRWSNLWLQSIAISNRSSQFKSLAEDMVGLFSHQKGGLEANDVVVLAYENDSCSYQINGVTLASDLPGELFNLFLNAWIGKAPPSVDFRNAILGKDIDLESLQARLNGINPAQDRIALVEEWFEPKIDEAQLLAEQQAAEAAKAAEAEAKAAEEAKAEEEAALAEERQKQLEAERLAREEAARKEQEEALTLASVLALNEYLKATKKEIYGSLRYPRRAEKLGYEGQVRLNIEVDRNGKLLNVEASSNSPYKSLDRAAISAVKRAAPYEPVPDVIRDETLNLSIPFRFSLVKK